MADQPTEKPMERQDPDGPDGPGQQLQCGLSSPTLSASLLLHAAEPSILATWGEQKINTGGDSLESSPSLLVTASGCAVGSCARLVIS